MTVFIDYDLPEGPGACALGWLLDGFYAGWCTRPWPLTPRATSRSRTDLGTRTYCREAEAVDPFVYRVGLEIRALTAALGELDTLVFTAGIEEHPPVIRERIGGTAAWLGVQIDPDANFAGETVIRRLDSAVEALVLPTDEEMAVAREVPALVGQEF